MARFSYKNNRKRPKIWSIVSYIVFGLITIWLLASMYYELSPVDILKKSFVSIGSVGSGDTVESLQAEIAEKDSIINALEIQLSNKANTGLKKAIVKISSNTLNLRDKPSLNSGIVLQIPAESEVDILFYDTEKYYLEGKAGKWCKIQYAGQEGWVWGNYLLEIE